MVEEGLLLLQQLTALFVFVAVAVLIYFGHRYGLEKAASRLLPSIQRSPWATPPTNALNERRLDASIARLKWKASWYLAGTFIGAGIGSLSGLAAAYLAFGGYELVDSFPIGSRAIAQRTGRGYDPVGNAAHGIAMRLITFTVVAPFILSGAGIGIRMSNAIVSKPGNQ